MPKPCIPVPAVPSFLEMRHTDSRRLWAMQRIHNKLIPFSRIRCFPPLSPLGANNRRNMGYGQHFRGAHRGPSNRRVAEDGSIPSVHPAGFHAEPTYEPSIHGQGSGQPTTNHPPVYPFALTRSSSGIHSCGVGGGSYVSHPVGRSIPQPLPHADVACLRDPNRFVPLRR